MSGTTGGAPPKSGPQERHGLLMRRSLILPVLLALCAVAWASQTTGVLSVGKFYGFSAAPSSSYPDRWANEYTSGTKLTDELTGADWPMDGWVGWESTPLTVTVDLGKSYAVSGIGIHAQSRTDWGIRFPASMAIETSTDGEAWTPCGTPRSFPADTAAFSAAWVAGDGGAAAARFVRLALAPAAASWIMLDELQVDGTITDTRKFVPGSGCYHGAYPTDPFGYGYLYISNFESLAQKALRMVLWYADWAGSFQSEVGYVVDSDLAGRYLEVGFLPYNTTSAQIAAGSHDVFLKQWFTDCRTKNHPTWIRAMNEMNGSWTFANSTEVLKYGGDPQTYRWAWRRMYNIAEKVGATGDRQIFVWSPNSPGYPSDAWNHFTNYYPGAQYVDWVGLSVYSSGEMPTQLIAEAYGIYSTNKPMMIAEGGAYETATNKPAWITDWFRCLKNDYPIVKAAVWFQAGTAPRDFRIDTSAAALAAYRAGVADPYFLGSLGGVEAWDGY
jgi:hypothetical protein